MRTSHQRKYLDCIPSAASFGSGAAIVMARAIARDVYPAHELPKVLSLMTLVTMIAPLLAPLLGGFYSFIFSGK